MAKDGNSTPTPEQVLEKMERYCAYRDRCRREADEKLRSFGLTEDENTVIMRSLEDGRFLDEERFARSFVRGKYRIKKWGETRLRSELAAKGIPGALIEEAIGEINRDEYRENFKKLFDARVRRAGGLDTRQQKAAVYNYLYSKGYPAGMIWEAFNVK